jgi:hypothetical protein
MMTRARAEKGLTYDQVADGMSAILGGETPAWDWYQHLSSGPPRPLANPTWVDAALQVVGLTWFDVLESLDLPSKSWRRRPGVDAPD